MLLILSKPFDLIKEVEGRNKCHLLHLKTSTALPPEKNAWGTRIDVGRGPFPPKCLAFLVISCFERRCRKQNTIARLKSKHFPPQICGLATPLGMRRNKHPKKTCSNKCWHFALEGVYCITRALKMIRCFSSTSQREMLSL